VLAVCQSPANSGPGIPCTNYATTYTYAGVACPNGAQDTPQPATTSSCQTQGDPQGNIGFWAPSGQYDYTVTIGTTTFGPYTVTLGGAGSGGTPGGTNGQLQYNNAGVFAGLPCVWNAIAGNLSCSSSLNITGPLNIGTTTLTACGSAHNCMALLQGSTPGTPTAGQNYFYSTVSGWNCDVNGGVEFPCFSNGLPVLNVKAYGATGNGTTNDTAAIQAAINAVPQTGSYKGGNVYFPCGTYYTSAALTNGPSPYTYHGVRLIGEGTVGRGGGCATILTNGAYYAYIMGNASTANALGFQAENLAFQDNAGTGLGAFDVIALTDGALTNITCENYYVGVCVTLDGGNGVSQFFFMTNIYTYHTKTRIQTVRRIASEYISGGEGNCQNSGATDVIPNSIDLDLGYSRQVSGTGTITTSGTGFTVNTFTSGLGSFTQDYVNAPIIINSVAYTIATVTSGTTGTLTTSAGTQSSVNWSISGRSGSGETTINTQAQNCQTGIALFNYGSTKIYGKALEQTIFYRPSGSFGVIVAGDSPSLANDVQLWGTQVSDAGTGVYIGPHTQNTKIDGVFSDGTNGADLVADATALSLSVIDPVYRASGWTVNLATISRSSNIVTATTTPNLSNDAGNLCVYPGTLVTVYGVTGDTTFNGTFATTSVSCNDSTDVTTLTWAQTGASDSGTINTTACVGASGGSCIRALSSVLSTSTGLGVIELTGGQTTTNQVWQTMNSPPDSAYPVTTVQGTATVTWDGAFFDCIYGDSGYGVLHCSDGPIVPYAGTSANYYTPQPAVTTSETTCTTPVNASVVENVCQTSDDKGTVLADATNGTTYCIPALPDPGYPVGFSHGITYAISSGTQYFAIVLPGQTSPYGSITCPGTSGTTLNGSTSTVLLPPGQGIKIFTNGTNWFSNSGVQSYVSPTPGPALILTADSSSITATGPGTADYLFVFPPLVPLTNYTFRCSGTTVQSTSGAGIGIAFGTATTAATNMEAHATVATSPTATASQSSGNQSGTSEYAIYAGSTGTITTQLPFSIDGGIEVGATAPSNFEIGFYTINASDPVVVKRDSSCKLTVAN
jgi:Pectate lyase superfamily protein